MDQASCGGRRTGRHLIETVLVPAVAIWGCSSSSNHVQDAGAQPAEAGAMSEDAGLLPTEVAPTDPHLNNADGAEDTDDGSACVALASVSDQCPADWAAAIADPALPRVANVTADYARTADEVRANLAGQVAGQAARLAVRHRAEDRAQRPRHRAEHRDNRERSEERAEAVRR